MFCRPRCASAVCRHPHAPVYAFYTTNGMPSGMPSVGVTDIYDSLSEMQTTNEGKIFIGIR